MSQEPSHATRQARYRARQTTRFAELEAENKRLRAALASRDAKPAKPAKRAASEQDDSDGLKAKLTEASKRNAALRRQLNAIRDSSKGRVVVMSSQLVRAIRVALHPDTAADNPTRQKRLEELSKEFGSLTIVPDLD